MENLKLAVTALIIVVVAWYGLDAFFDLVGGIYAFLDQYIWAFFAGIIAFFFAIFLVGLMIQISLITAFLVATGIATIYLRFKKEK